MPPPNYGYDDDTRSLVSVPSLTGTRSTADSISVLDESPTGPNAHRSLIDTCPNSADSTRLHCFKFIQTGNPREELTCQTCETKPDRFLIGCTNCAFHQCRLCFDLHTGLSFRKFESRFEPVGSQYNSTARLWTFLSDKNDPFHPIISASRIYQPALQTTSRQDPQQAVIQCDDNLAIYNGYNAVIAPCDLFRVTILSWDGGVRHVYATECEGEQCYISKHLVKFHMIEPGANRTRITWERFGELNFTDTWFEILEQSIIEGKGRKADLFLGRDREKQQLNFGETIQYPRELNLPLIHPPSIMQFKSDAEIVSSGQSLEVWNHTMHHEDLESNSPSMITHQDVEDLSDEVTEGGCSWTSSSDESSATPRGLIATRREQMIKNITLEITQWLRSRFTRAHTTVNEATVGSCKDRTTSSTSSVQCPKDQVQQVGKRKRDNAESDGGEDDNNDDGIVRPPHPGANDIKGKGKEIIRFACPYFKYNPTKYKQWPICPGPGWPDVHRVK